MTPAAAPAVLVVDDDALMRAAIQGMPKSVGRYENSHTKV